MKQIFVVKATRLEYLVLLISKVNQRYSLLKMNIVYGLLYGGKPFQWHDTFLSVDVPHLFESETGWKQICLLRNDGKDFEFPWPS